MHDNVGMPTLALYKPMLTLSRFTADGSANATLATLGLPRDVWPIGRLDADSEGLLVLSSDKSLVDRLLSPRFHHEKTYWAQVERVPDEAALSALRAGVLLDGTRTRPAQARLLHSEPALPPRSPPIRFRKNVPTAWLELVITEGKNRQVRRMTAAVGHPTLRLVRVAVGALELGDLAPGKWRTLDAADVALLCTAERAPRPS